MTSGPFWIPGAGWRSALPFDEERKLYNRMRFWRASALALGITMILGSLVLLFA